MTSPQLAQALSDRYRIERELGQGGMATVYLALDLKHQRRVAVKVLRAELAASLGPERFLREVSIAASLQHPHILPLHDSGVADGFLYYVMPYVEGESLRQKLAREGELPIVEAVRILRDLADALAHAHKRGVVHRDIKPENVMLSERHALVTDFGVAKAVSDASGHEASALTTAGVALGTPAYMAPEQAVADPHTDHRADIYAFGVVAYELLTGRPPFTGATPQAILAAHVTTAADPVTKYRASIPPALAALVMKCLEKKPADRWQHAEELVPALDSLVTPEAGSRSVTSAAPRRMRIAVSGGLLIAAALATAAWLARGRASGPNGPVTSLAVLPAEVVAGDSTLDYLAEGLTDGLQEEMRRSGLRVAARASTSWYKGKAARPQDVARQLEVESVLAISMRRLGNRLRVSAELYDAKGFSRWSGSVERAAVDPLALQDEVQRALVTAFKAALSNQSVTVARRSHTPDAETYDLYLRGRHFNNSSTRAGLEKAREYFQAAIARDSLFASAYAELAVCYMWLADSYEAPRVVIPLAITALRRAVELDPQSSAAHAALGELEGLYLRNWETADRELEQAIALDSTNAQAHLWRAFIAGIHGRRREAVDGILKSIRLDPLWPYGVHANVMVLSWLGEQDSALAVYARAREVAPDYFIQEAGVGDVYRALGRFDDALAAEREGERILKRPPAFMVITLVLMGRREEALAVMRSIEARIAGGEYVVPEWVARAWMALGQPDRAMDYLERGLDNMSIAATFVPLLPELRRMPRTERYRRYLEKANLLFVLDTPPP